MGSLSAALCARCNEVEAVWPPGKAVEMLAGRLCPGCTGRVRALVRVLVRELVAQADGMEVLPTQQLRLGLTAALGREVHWRDLAAVLGGLKTRSAKVEGEWCRAYDIEALKKNLDTGP